MHDGCTGDLVDGQDVVKKLRMMGFEGGMLPDALELACHDCGEALKMTTFEFRCPKCGAVHGVTPCHAYDARYVRCAGRDY